MTENYTPPAVWQRWADEGSEGATMTNEYGYGFADGMDARAQELKRLQAQLAAVTAERDALKAQLDAVRESRDDMEDKYFGSLIDDERDPYP